MSVNQGSAEGGVRMPHAEGRLTIRVSRESLFHKEQNRQTTGASLHTLAAPICISLSV